MSDLLRPGVTSLERTYTLSALIPTRNDKQGASNFTAFASCLLLVVVIGPEVTYFQLTHYEHCDITLPTYSDLDSCAIFKDAHPSTMALSVLVTIEMLNTFNALSENQSLLVTPPWANPWVTVAVAASLLCVLLDRPFDF